MRNLLKILFAIMTTVASAHEDIIVVKNYENIMVTTFTGFYYEEINKTLMIGQYAKILTDKMNYKNKINLIFSHNYTKNVKDNYKVWIHKNNNSDKIDSITIRANCTHNSFKEILQLIEYSIITKEHKLNDDKIKMILSKNKSDLINEVLKKKIYRPQEIEKLKSRYLITYYIQNEIYFIISKVNNNENLITTMKSIFQFTPLNNSELIVFENPYRLDYIIMYPEIQTIG